MILFGTATTVFAQAGGENLALPADPIVVKRREAPMRPIFKNVLWGSVAGALVWSGIQIVDDSKPTSERYAVSEIFVQAVIGATYGGILGLGVGIYVSLMGITFEDTFFSLNFSPLDENDYHGRQRRLFGNDQPVVAKSRIMSLQIKF